MIRPASCWVLALNSLHRDRIHAMLTQRRATGGEEPFFSTCSLQSDDFLGHDGLFVSTAHRLMRRFVATFALRDDHEMTRRRPTEAAVTNWSQNCLMFTPSSTVPLKFTEGAIDHADVGALFEHLLDRWLTTLFDLLG